MNNTDTPRLIEDYLPIQAISAEASREKSVRKGGRWAALRHFEEVPVAVLGASGKMGRWDDIADRPASPQPAPRRPPRP